MLCDDLTSTVFGDAKQKTESSTCLTVTTKDNNNRGDRQDFLPA